MLKIEKKEFEIEEPIKLIKNVNGQEQVLYDFMMRLTEDDMLNLKDILFGKSEDKNNSIADICFKENKEEFKKIAGNYRYEETIETIKSFLLDFFIKKQMSPLNTTITDLTKIMSNFQKLK